MCRHMPARQLTKRANSQSTPYKMDGLAQNEITILARSNTNEETYYWTTLHLRFQLTLHIANLVNRSSNHFVIQRRAALLKLVFVLKNTLWRRREKLSSPRFRRADACQNRGTSTNAVTAIYQCDCTLQAPLECSKNVADIIHRIPYTWIS